MMIALLTFVLCVLLSLPVSSVNCSLFFVFYQALVALGLEFSITLAPDGWAMFIIELIVSVCSLRFFWVGIYNVIDYLYSYITYPRLLIFADLLLNVLTINLAVFQVYFIIIANPLLLAILVAAPSSVAIVMFLVFGPLVLFMNMGMLFTLIDLFALTFLGMPLNSVYHEEAIRKFRTFCRKILEGMQTLVMTRGVIRIMLSHLLATTLKMSLIMVKMPVEVVEMILVARPKENYRLNSRHFYKRLILGLDLFFIALMPTSSILVLIFWVFIFWVLVGWYILFALYGMPAFGVIGVIVLQVLPKMGIEGLSWYLERMSSHLQSVYVHAVLTAAKFSANLPVLVKRDDNTYKRITERTNINLFSESERKRLFEKLSDTRGFDSVALPFLLFVFVFEYMLRIVFSGVLMLISAPLNLLNALIWFCVAFLLPDFIFDLVDVGIVHGLALFRQFWPEINRYLRMIGISAIYGVRYAEILHDEPLRGGMDLSELPKLNQLFVRTWVSLVRRSILRTVEYLDKVRLPEMIQAAYKPPSLDSVRSTYAFLQDIGFPVDQTFIDSLTRPEASSYLAEWGSWKNWLIGTSNYGLGFRNVKVGLRKWLPSDFFPEIQGYLHTTGFTGIAEEIRSTARYWNGNHTLTMEGEDLDACIEDTFHMVEPQFGNSRLSTFREIYNRWTKRFNMGFGFGYIDKETKRLRQYTRQQVIDYMGGRQSFLNAWKKIFHHSQNLLLPSPVFTKWESLKVKKMLSRSVRTVVGSAFTHHVMTTVFNYKPNHNYHPWENPSKVGMPINGQNFNRLWLSMAKHSCIWAGDMTAFDSSQNPAMLRVCAEIRKRGFQYHRDYHKICEIIDISYDMLRDQPMAFKNFGDIAWKSQGATTGHSSTTPDNTVMLIANYMFAWRAITGLRAREMEKFVELANFGDDHIMSYDPVFGFTPEKCIEVMAKIGTVMRDEAPGQDYLPLPGRPLPPNVSDWRDCKFSFLSKMPLPIDAAIASELQAANVTTPLVFATCHDRSRLIGKIKGEVERRKENDPVKSYASLVGYLYLTAHHHDIYQQLAKDVVKYRNEALIAITKQKGNPNSIMPAPSYNDVIRQWYSKEPFPFKDEDYISEDEDKHEIVIYTSPDPFGVFVRWLSDLPTLLSPRYKNIRWADWIQGKLADQLSWPITFIGHANGCANDLAACRSLLARTPYSYLRSEIIVPREGDFGNLVVKHWVYVCMSRVVSYRRSFSPLDLIRLLDSAFINLLYMGTGRLTQSVVELDLHVVDILIVYLCSFIKFNVYLPPLMYYIPAPSEWFSRFITYLISVISPGGSIDYQPLRAQLDRLRISPDASFVLAAPTGVGKSTRMINMIQNHMQRRVVCIVPRHLIARSVGEYMQKLFPDTGVGISTEGFKFREDDRIVYCTVQSFFSNPKLRKPGDLVVLDEAHISEPHYGTVRNYLSNPLISKIYMTATPPDSLNSVVKLQMPSTQTFSVQKATFDVALPSKYLSDCADFANERTPYEKMLIFVPTIKQMDELASRIRHKCCRLSSKHNTLDEGATCYLATSVADAGLTIPDVSFVLTMDIDVTVVSRVANSLAEAQTETKASDVVRWFRLSKHTLKQRMGRTGRTSNGVFLQYNYTGIDLPILDEVIYSLEDYLLALRPAVATGYTYIPERYKTLTPDETAALRIYDDLPHPPSSLYAFRNNVLVCREMEEYVNKSRGDESSVAARVGMDVMLDSLMDKMKNPSFQLAAWSKKIFNQSDVNPQDSWENKPGPSEPVSLGYKPVSEEWDEDEPMTRQNVSGSGLLCGSRIVVGLVYTVYGVRISEDLVTQEIINMLPEGMRKPEYMSFFDWNQVRTMLLHYGIKCHLIADGVPVVDPLEFNRCPEHNEATAYLDNNHYNYLGYRVRGPIEDDKIDFWWDGPF